MSSWNGFLRGARPGRGDISAPEGSETGIRRPGLAGVVKITLNGVKTKGFKGIRGRIVRVKRVETDIGVFTWLETRVRSLLRGHRSHKICTENHEEDD